MADNERIVREFIPAWSRLDPAELAGYITEDGCYHNIPAAPVHGRAAVERFFREWRDYFDLATFTRAIQA